MKEQNYIPYLKIASELDVEKGSTLWLAADLTRIAFTAKRKEGGFDAQQFIKSFQDQIGTGGTLVISSFNFNLENGAHYSQKRTLPMTGALAVEAMKMDGFRRTANPLHSFLVWGRNADELVGLRNKSSFDTDSPFYFLHNYQGKMVILGTSLSNAFTFVHYVEELNKVRYRKYKKIKIYQYDDSRLREFMLYAKKLGWTMDMSGLEKLLLDSGVAKLRTINGISCYSVNLIGSFPVIQEDIISNRGRNIARFSPKLYLRDLAKVLLGKAGILTKSDKISHDPGLL